MEPEADQFAALLSEARLGSRDALGQLLEAHRNHLVLLARIQLGRRLQGKVDASDLVQDVNVEAYRAFDRFAGDTRHTFLAWLRQILAGQLAHLVRRYCGTQARDVCLEQTLERELADSSQMLDNALVDQRTPPDKAAMRREHGILLADALARLPPDYREAIIFRQLEGLSFADIATRLGRSVDSVQKLWVRALDRLRREMETAQ
jgi:RNA polymerase sigma-70 factor (ECF subfamily)